MSLWDHVVAGLYALCEEVIAPQAAHHVKADIKRQIPPTARWVSPHAFPLPKIAQRRESPQERLRRGQPGDSRSVQADWEGYREGRLVIILHDADRAGLHLDLHFLGPVESSFVINIRNKPIAKELRYNKSGELTQASREKLIAFIHDEFDGNGAWVAQNLDHNDTQATTTWLQRDEIGDGYGAGNFRQEVLDTRVAYLKTGTTMEAWVPELSERKLYAVNAFQESAARDVPVWKFGLKKPTDYTPKSGKLKLRHVQSTDELRKWVGEDAVLTQKLDGASTHVKRTTKGTSAWSPRISKRSGRRISYDSKIGALHSHGGTSFEGMGELMYQKPDGNWVLASQVGGILNSKDLPPSDHRPTVFLYKVDTYDGKKVKPDTASQRYVIQRICDEDGSDTLRPVPMATWEDADGVASGVLDWEGLVAVPKDGDINSQGVKFKPRGEHLDGVIEDITFREGPRGGITGVIVYRDPSTGRTFQTASGIDHDTKLHLASNKDAYVGRTVKLKGFTGGNHRAVTYDGIHPDK